MTKIRSLSGALTLTILAGVAQAQTPTITGDGETYIVDGGPLVYLPQVPKTTMMTAR